MYRQNSKKYIVLVYGSDPNKKTGFLKYENENAGFFYDICYPHNPCFIYCYKKSKYISYGNLNLTSNMLEIFIEAHGYEDNHDMIESEGKNGHKIPWQDVVNDVLEIMKNLRRFYNTGAVRINLNFRTCHALNPINTPQKSFAFQVYNEILKKLNPTKYVLTAIAADTVVFLSDGGCVAIPAQNSQLILSFQKQYNRCIKKYTHMNTKQNKWQSRFYAEQYKQHLLKNKCSWYLITNISRKINGLMHYQPVVINMSTDKGIPVGNLLYWNCFKFCLTEIYPKFNNKFISF